MKTMTCDEAFEALTDLSTAEYPALEQHLATCARCRQMRDVLAPALALFAGEPPAEAGSLGESHAAFRDSTSPWAANVLRLWHGSPSRDRTTRSVVPLSPAALVAADDAARQLSARHCQRRWREFPSRRLLRTAAVFLLGAAAALGVATLGTDRAGGTPSAPPESGACLWASAGQAQPQPSRAEQVILSCVACHLPASGR